MELELNRIDYAIVGLTSRKCMKLLPPSSTRGAQKIVVGDQDGVLNIFCENKGEIQALLKTPPGPKIARLDLGGTYDGQKDKIFIASESKVRGYTKKGKRFLEFDTNLAESITVMCVCDVNLFVCGQHSLHHYADLKDENSFTCNEVIRDLVVVTSDSVGSVHYIIKITLHWKSTVYQFQKKKLTPILACDDRVIRILEDSSLLYSVPIPSCPTVLHEFLKSKDGENQVIYGTTDGGVGLLSIGRELKNSWMLEPDPLKGQVTCLETFDLTCDGNQELILGRDDGLIEVYKLGQEEEDIHLMYSYTCNETVTSLTCGIIRGNDCPEIVVTTYSVPYAVLLFVLSAEIDELETRVYSEKDKYHIAAENNDNALSTIPAIAINDRFYLHREDASYTLSIEVQTSVDNILIQSDVPVDLLDIEKNSAVVSFSECNPADGNFLLATYRCQVNTTRLDLKIRTIEGQYGTLQTYVTPNIQPKCCQLRSYKIKPLSLHTRIHIFDPKRPYNVLNLRGGFSFAEIHAWIEFCLPEVPSKPPPEEPAVLIFSSTFLDTILQCTYSKGEAEFKSDNISTISILKDVVSKEASRNDKKRRNLDISWEINEGSIKHTLDLLKPKLEHQHELVRQVEILQSMTELDLSGDGIQLTDEYSKILANEKAIMEEYTKQPSYLDRLYGMVTDLYIDKHKFRGNNVKNKIAPLLHILDRENYVYENLLEFFNQ
ncbi:hypothetical protein RUM43_006402 [Polyplax serrata]|uniref:Bardet-Biedl syndrome 7 protein homolog n=1 Tax=Polyplax serrata TaxID=468196 RepID=A0AAN8P1A7_POLSC